MVDKGLTGVWKGVSTPAFTLSTTTHHTRNSTRTQISAPALEAGSNKLRRMNHAKINNKCSRSARERFYIDTMAHEDVLGCLWALLISRAS